MVDLQSCGAYNCVVTEVGIENVDVVLGLFAE